MNISDKLKYTKLYEIVLPIVLRRDLLRWKRSGKNLPIPHLVKQKLVKEYASRFSIKTFVETGTYLGTMTNAVKNTFDSIYTIELDRKLYERARNKFKRVKKIQVLQGDSAKVIAKVLKEIETPVLFWLDAHYSAGITSRRVGEEPILKELGHILKHKVKDHVILIDDANLFDGKDGYPKFSTLKAFITKNGKGLKISKIHNVFVVMN